MTMGNYMLSSSVFNESKVIHHLLHVRLASLVAVFCLILSLLYLNIIIRLTSLRKSWTNLIALEEFNLLI